MSQYDMNMLVLALYKQAYEEKKESYMSSARGHMRDKGGVSLSDVVSIW